MKVKKPKDVVHSVHKIGLNTSCLLAVTTSVVRQASYDKQSAPWAATARVRVSPPTNQTKASSCSRELKDGFFVCLFRAAPKIVAKVRRADSPYVSVSSSICQATFCTMDELSELRRLLSDFRCLSLAPLFWTETARQSLERRRSDVLGTASGAHRKAPLCPHPISSLQEMPGLDWTQVTPDRRLSF